MDVRRIPPLSLMTIALLLAAACSQVSSGSSPTPSLAPAPSVAPTLSPAPTPSAHPSDLPTPATSPRPDISPAATGNGGVTSEAQAAALVFTSNPKFTQILPANPAAVGQSTTYTTTDTGSGYLVSVTMGSGDCQSSCTSSHTWNYSVSHSGDVTLTGETGDPVEVTTPTPSANPATVTIRLLAGPVCPVEQNPPSSSCADRPIAGTEVVVRDPTGAEVARATSDATGAAVFTIPGGAYYAAAAPVSGVVGQAPATAFSVVGGSTVGFSMGFDTGIR